jgi:hypothetical protein
MDAEALPTNGRGSWLRRNRWRVGGLVAAVVAGGIWWRRTARARDFSVGSVSERWLAEQAFEAGQHVED